MTHRVHTILSLLAEDHAPAALRPSILLAVDWPTVAEEAPATGDDALFAAAMAGLLSFGERARENHSPRIKAATVPLAARLATVAASLTATGDKAMAAHATALWGAAAALVGLPISAAAPSNVDPSTSEVYLRALAHKANGLMFGMSRTPAEQAAIIGTVIDKVKTHEFSDREELRAAHERAKGALDTLANKAADIVPGVIAAGPAEKATLIATALDRVRDMKAERDAARDERDANKRGEDAADRVLKLVRKALGWEMGKGMLSDFAAAIRKRADEADSLRAENTRLRAQVDRMIAAMREDAPAPVKPRPQPGDMVQWDEVEDGCLYAKDWGGCRFVMVTRGERSVASGPEDLDIETFLLQRDVLPPAGEKEMTLVARDLGTDPEAWRKAMREWTASESSRPR